MFYGREFLFRPSRNIHRNTSVLRVTAYTGGKDVPSARFRVRQYIPALSQLGIDIRERAARFGCYPPTMRCLRPAWGVLALAERFYAALGSRDTDVTLLQREMLSTFATVERFTKVPRILDVDDAIWLLRGGQSAISLARCCDLVICGNRYIADFFGDYTRNVVVLPTPVDTDRYRPGEGGKRDMRVICWSGTSSGLPFLHGIEPTLSAVLAVGPERRLRVICDKPPRFRRLPADQVEFVLWSEGVEVTAIQGADLAIMPLDDSPWARGKCSYKLLTYMACGLPVVATPVGMNRELLARGTAGLAASSPADWADAIESILASPARAAEMGAAGRELVTRDYSLRTLSLRMAEIVTAVGGAN
jgi:glycosyltransferase involved in cell wall biosynthesis